MSSATYLTLVVALVVLIIYAPQLTRAWRRWRRRTRGGPPDSGGGVWDCRDVADPDDQC
jgi:hypothetical protein